jgi:CheY-like chemotaxis protein
MTNNLKTTKNVLIVDDDYDVCDLLVLLLNNHGYRATGVSNGAEALTHLRQAEQPDLILLDLMMPIMDAWEFRAQQKGDPALGTIPVVLLSATDEVREHAHSLQAADYLCKPIDFGRLLETVERLCLAA